MNTGTRHQNIFVMGKIYVYYRRMGPLVITPSPTTSKHVHSARGIDNYRNPKSPIITEIRQQGNLLATITIVIITIFSFLDTYPAS